MADASVDAVHIVTGLARHAPEAVSALDAGKHVACAVPMGLSFEELRCGRRGAEPVGPVVHDDGDGSVYAGVHMGV